MRQKTLFLAFFILTLSASAQETGPKESKPDFEWYKKGRNSFGGMIYPLNVGKPYWTVAFEFEYSRFLMDQLSLNLNNTVVVGTEQLDFEYEVFGRYHLTKSKLSPFVQAGYLFGFGGSKHVGYYENAFVAGGGLSYKMFKNRLSVNLFLGKRIQWKKTQNSNPELFGPPEQKRKDTYLDGSFTIKYHF